MSTYRYTDPRNRLPTERCMAWYRQVAELSKERLTMRQTADRMGMTVSKVRDLRFKAKALGMTVLPVEPPPMQGTEAWRARNIARYNARRAAGLCVDCGAPADGVARCEAHTARQRKLRDEHAARAEKDMQLDTGATDTSVARCPRCFLTLPCGECLPTIHYYASSRRGSATGL